MKIKWIGFTSIVPPYGEMRSNEEYEVDKQAAASLIAQGLAVEAVSEQPKKEQKK